jgi:hypothetical protein
MAALILHHKNTVTPKARFTKSKTAILLTLTKEETMRGGELGE